MVGSSPRTRACPSLFNRTLTFDDYTNDELVEIVAHQADEHQYDLPTATHDALADHFSAIDHDQRAGNGRFARQVFQEMTERHASRVADVTSPTKEELSALLPADVPEWAFRSGSVKDIDDVKEAKK